MHFKGLAYKNNEDPAKPLHPKEGQGRSTSICKTHRQWQDAFEKSKIVLFLCYISHGIICYGTHWEHQRDNSNEYPSIW